MANMPKSIIKKGRRPRGSGNSKEDILRAALKAFAKWGYDRATVRTIAKEARVDPALLFHYFGGKDRLFAEAMKSKMRRPERAEWPDSERWEERGTRIARLFLERWGADRGPTPFLGLMRSAASNPRAAAILRKLFAEEITPVVSKMFGIEDSELRVALVGSQLFGVAALRYVLRVEPLASMPIEDVARFVGPTIARYLGRNVGAGVE